MPYEDDPAWNSSDSSENISSHSRGLANASTLEKRKETSISDKPEQAKRKRKKKKGKTSKYKGVFGQYKFNNRFILRSRIKHDGEYPYLGTFKLQADAAHAYNQAFRLLPPRTSRTHPNFANEEEYQAARQDEIRVKHRELKSKLPLKSFAEQFSPKFLSEAQIRDKLGLPPAPPPAGESLLTPPSHISQTDSHNDQGSCGHDDKDTLSSDSSDDEADTRKAKVPRVSPESKPPNKDKSAVKEELIIDLVSSDEEDSVKVKEEIVDSRVVQSIDVGARTESVPQTVSVKVGEELWQLGVVQIREAHTGNSIVPEDPPAIEENQARNELNIVQTSPTYNTTTNEHQNNAHLVLKTPLMQILKIQDMNDVMEKKIEEYCKILCNEKGLWNEKHLDTLKEASEKELEEMIGFMLFSHKSLVKQWVKECREASEGDWI